MFQEINESACPHIQPVHIVPHSTVRGLRARRFASSRAVAQLGRAPRSGRGGRGFESRRPDQLQLIGNFSRTRSRPQILAG